MTALRALCANSAVSLSLCPTLPPTPPPFTTTPPSKPQAGIELVHSLEVVELRQGSGT